MTSLLCTFWLSFLPLGPVTLRGRVAIRRQIGGKPVEYVLSQDGADYDGIPLRAEGRCAAALADAAAFGVRVRLTGRGVEHEYRRLLEVEGVAAEREAGREP